MKTLRKPILGGSAPMGLGIRFVMVLMLLISNGVSDLAAKELLSDRRRAVHPARAGSPPVRYDIRWKKLAASFPSFEKGLPLPQSILTAHDGLPDWLGANVGLYSDVREYDLPVGGEHRVLIHIIDLHEVEEVQRNISSTLGFLAASVGGENGLLVGLEGATERFLTSDYRGLATPPVVRRAADRFLKAGLISGPEYFGLTTDKQFRLWGAEDSLLYEANLRALTVTVPGQAKDDATIAQALSKVEELKGRMYPATLKDLDQTRTQYEAGKLGLTAYVRRMSEGAPSEFIGPTLRLFLDATAHEDDLSFSGVAEERGRLLDVLTLQLNQSEAQQLVETGLAFRWGRAPFSRFQALLKNLCAKYNVDLTASPALVAFFNYATRVEGLDPVLLLKETDALAERRIRPLLSSPPLAEADSLNEEVRLIDKMNRFVLSSEAYKLLVSRRSSVQRWQERGAALEVGKNAGVWPDLSSVMERHEQFYIQAEARNLPLVQNILPLWTDDKPAVLVAGDYHSAGIRAAALAQGLGYISLIPRVSFTPNLPRPLTSFHKNSRRREWVFRGNQSALPSQRSTAGLSMLLEWIGVIVAEEANEALFAQETGGVARRVVIATEETIQAAKKHVELKLTEEGVTTPQRDPQGRLSVTVKCFVSSASELLRGSIGAVIESTIVVPRDGNREQSDIFVRILPPHFSEKLYEKLKIDVLHSSAVAFLIKVKGTVAVYSSELTLWMRQTTRKAAVVLSVPLLWIGKTVGLSWLEGRVVLWKQARLLSEERELFRAAVQAPEGVRGALLLRLAEAHPVRINSTWAAIVVDAMGNLIKSKTIPDIRLAEWVPFKEGESLTVRVRMGDVWVGVRFRLSSARVLTETPAYCLSLVKQVGPVSFDVSIQMPVVSEEAMSLRVMARLLREIKYRVEGQSTEEAYRNAIDGLDELKNEQFLMLQQLRRPIADLDNNILTWTGIEIKNPENLNKNFPAWCLSPEKPLGFVTGTGDTWNYSTMDPGSDLGLLNILLGSAPEGVSKEVEKVFLSNLIDSLHRVDELIKARHNVLSAWPWSEEHERLVGLVSDMVLSFVSSVGLEQGQRAALAGIPRLARGSRRQGPEQNFRSLPGGNAQSTEISRLEKAAPSSVGLERLHDLLVSSISTRFLPLIQTLSNLLSLSGVSLEKSDPDALERFMSDLLWVYVSRFRQGFLQVQPVPTSIDRTVAQNPGTATSVAVGVFYFPGSVENSNQAKNLLRFFLEHQNLENCRMMVLMNGGQSPEEILLSIETLLESEFGASPKLGVAREILRNSGVLSVVSISDLLVEGAVSMAEVIDRVQASWPGRVGKVDVFSEDVNLFRLDASQGLISWALYLVVKGDVVLTSEIMASHNAKEAIRAFIRQLA